MRITSGLVSSHHQAAFTVRTAATAEQHTSQQAEHAPKADTAGVDPAFDKRTGLLVVNMQEFSKRLERAESRAYDHFTREIKKVFSNWGTGELDSGVREDMEKVQGKLETALREGDSATASRLLSEVFGSDSAFRGKIQEIGEEALAIYEKEAFKSKSAKEYRAREALFGSEFLNLSEELSANLDKGFFGKEASANWQKHVSKQMKNAYANTYSVTEETLLFDRGSFLAGAVTGHNAPEKKWQREELEILHKIDAIFEKRAAGAKSSTEAIDGQLDITERFSYAIGKNSGGGFGALLQEKSSVLHDKLMQAAKEGRVKLGEGGTSDTTLDDLKRTLEQLEAEDERLSQLGMTDQEILKGLMLMREVQEKLAGSTGSSMGGQQESAKAASSTAEASSLDTYV